MLVESMVLIIGLATVRPQHYTISAQEYASGQLAPQYPAGIDPASCPNYPNCENPLVALSQAPKPAQYSPVAPQFTPVSQYSAVPRYTSPQYAAAPVQYASSPYQQSFAPAPAPQQYSAALGPQYQGSPSKQYTPEVQNALDRGEYIGDGDYHGEGLSEAGTATNPVLVGPTYSQSQTYASPGSSYASPGLSAYAGQIAPVASPGPAQIPAGLDPAACPNYPFCH
ncbi:DNA-directed RNA polymerase II subunit RPB1-like isoform X2 [Aethina tumida]|uniref:DNA-directed RNA polymerase II subunit RPB1-like isoform X2 n=1 Tax=Aethina tumida TaxID=116153 RepID=UPI00096B474D|nr:DNA-directed RNA polymerase II subunit RPB1-like isoform X2 [Aethina tumida]